jgi:O-antigen ligase
MHHRRRNTIPRKTTVEEVREWLAAHSDAILLYGTFGLLMFGPVALGAVQPWSVFFLETGSVVLTLLWFRKQWVGGELTIEKNPLFLPMGVFGGLILLQIAFAGHGFRVLRIGVGGSAYRHDTIAGALLYCAYGMLCFLAGQTLRRGSQARPLAAVFAIYGSVIAAFALLQGISSNGKLYWVVSLTHGGAIYGPYVNHNHYAGLMELLVPIPLVLSFTRLAGEKERLASGIAAAIMVVTIFLSGSRGGMIAIFIELVILAVLLVRQRVEFVRQKKGLQIAVSLAAFVLVLVSLLTWLGGKELTSRVSSISTETRTELSGGMRLSIDRDTFRMFEQKPILGWGLGTFPTVYPQFRTFYTNFFVNAAHNDYLQLLSEMGLLGFGTMIWFLVELYRHALPKIGNWMSDVSSAVTLACTLGLSGILIHSLLDFNLQIPANAAIFYVFCTLAAAPPLQQRARKRRPATTVEEELLPASEVV